MSGASHAGEPSAKCEPNDGEDTAVKETVASLSAPAQQCRTEGPGWSPLSCSMLCLGGMGSLAQWPSSMTSPSFHVRAGTGAGHGPGVHGSAGGCWSLSPCCR